MSIFDPLPYMELAILEAKKAQAEGEVPVGAIIVDSHDEIIAKGHNEVEGLLNVTAHAEIQALNLASKRLGNWRLTGSRLICTLEPCPMCTSALVLARVSQVYYGCGDSRLGACGSLFNLAEHPFLPHKIQVFGGILEDECKDLLSEFFGGIRAKQTQTSKY